MGHFGRLFSIRQTRIQ
jgi:hypothetical protein